ncbi:C40 family peptidase [Knoellia locipacati]|uniref:C40 family peptidase n=1 Tax=Knoellia locipacati TaxID=882824 RepID=UPI003851685F
MTGAKASAVLAASGSLVAAFALPASAAPESAKKDARTSAPAAPVAAPVAAPAAPAITAPAVATPAKADLVGVAGVTAVAKPKPKPKPKPVVKEDTREGDLVAAAERSSDQASRSTTRTKISTTSVKQSSSQIVNIARTLLGIAYVYGGDDPSGFDCSGLTQYVYRKAGISIPRTASQQQREGTRVSDPQPGDLVFYGSPAWHVGIYTGGDMMIDSPRPGKYSSERNMFGTPTEFRRY